MIRFINSNGFYLHYIGKYCLNVGGENGLFLLLDGSKFVEKIRSYHSNIIEKYVEFKKMF